MTAALAAGAIMLRRPVVEPHLTDDVVDAGLRSLAAAALPEVETALTCSSDDWTIEEGRLMRDPKVAVDAVTLALARLTLQHDRMDAGVVDPALVGVSLDRLDTGIARAKAFLQRYAR